MAGNLAATVNIQSRNYLSIAVFVVPIAAETRCMVTAEYCHHYRKCVKRKAILELKCQ